MTVGSLQLPERVRTVDWAPQNDLLAHPAIRTFVTHGGANSLYEAAYHAVPIVSIPQMMADQRENARKVNALTAHNPASVLDWVMLHATDLQYHCPAQI